MKKKSSGSGRARSNTSMRAFGFKGDDAPVFARIRMEIAKALESEGVELREDISTLEMTIGTLSPTHILKQWTVSDYPFIGARYLSVEDGHEYRVYAATKEGEGLVCYRQSFLLSLLSSYHGIAVSLSVDAWLRSTMVLVSLDHAGFKWDGDRLAALEGDVRRSYPGRKVKAWGLSLVRRTKDVSLTFGARLIDVSPCWLKPAVCRIFAGKE